MGLLSGIWSFIVIMTVLVLFVAIFWVIAQAFREHVLWGLGVLFLPVVWIVFVALNWDESGRPFLLGLAASGVLVIEMLLTGGAAQLFGGWAAPARKSQPHRSFRREVRLAGSTMPQRNTKALWSLALLVLSAGCDDAKTKEAAAPAKDAAAVSEKAEAKPEQVDPLVAEAIQASKDDIAEVRAGLAKQSMAESMTCSDMHRRLPTVKPVDEELAAEVVQVCDYERPLSELDWTISQIEAEIAENAKRPNPHNLKRQVMSCASTVPKSARETIDKAGKMDDAAKAKLARFDELCPA